MASPYQACVEGPHDSEYTKLGKLFVKNFYQLQEQLDKREGNTPTNMQVFETYRSLYRDDSKKTFEGIELFGKQSICEHFEKKLAFKTIKYAVTTIDSQPVAFPAAGIMKVLVMVTGQLQPDEDKPLQFSHVLLIRAEPSLDGKTSLTIENEIFRIAVHNFAIV